MSKYPGSFIINEVGSAGDLANIYGVSERTIYRWLNKAAKESGIRPKAKHRTPRPSTLVKFKGTRKQLAKKYGVSESTVYRWIKNAKAGGTDIPSRRLSSKYPGSDTIINLLSNFVLTNKELAEQFDVSTRTINRWIKMAYQQEANKSKLRNLRKTKEYKLRRKKVNGVWVSYYEKVEEPEPEEPWEVPEEPVEEPWEVPEPDETIEEPWEVPDYDYNEDDRPEWEKLGMSEAQYNNLKDIISMITDFGLIDENSLFNNIPHPTDIIYMDEYIQYQYDQDPSMFYDPETHEERFDAEWLSNLPIWGTEFEYWLQQRIDIDNYEI